MVAITTQTYRQNSYHMRRPSLDAVTSGKPRFKVGYVELGATADNADTTTVDFYQQFGMLKVLTIVGFIHTTTDSVIVEEAPTTAYDGTLLTITVGGATANKTRFYAIYGI